MLWLYVQAPFAAFRTFTAGWYRPTAAFLTPSAAYGLLLNVAGIETRLDDGLSAMTITQFGLPSVSLALGAVPEKPARKRRSPMAEQGGSPPPIPRPVEGSIPTVHSLYQQLHNYPVGASGKERKEDAKGNKYNITPVRREFLEGVRACIGIDGPTELERRIREGLLGRHARYGLPFLGDNAFLLDRLELLDDPLPSHWYRRLGPDDEAGVLPNTTRLTSWIDRQDMSRTKSALYAPDPLPSDEVPGLAYWTRIEPPPAPPSQAKAKATKPTR